VGGAEPQMHMPEDAVVPIIACQNLACAYLEDENENDSMKSSVQEMK
jgi:hypothetical protein